MLLTDKRHLFVRVNDSNFPIVATMIDGQPSIISCRSTHPDAKVKLTTVQGNDVSSDEYTYNSKTGIIVASPSANYKGLFYCHALLANVTDSLLAVLHYKGQ